MCSVKVVSLNLSITNWQHKTGLLLRLKLLSPKSDLDFEFQNKALADYKRAYQLNPSSGYKKKVQQLTSLAKKSGGKSSKKKPSTKQAQQAANYAKRGNSKAKKKNYAGALKDYQRAYKLNQIGRASCRERV